MRWPLFCFLFGLLCAFLLLYDVTYSSFHVDDLEETERQYHFVIVSDMDHNSRDQKRLKWSSHLWRGVLYRNKTTGNFTVQIVSKSLLSSVIAAKNRSMELSELANYDGKILAVCDSTGIIYEIDVTKSKVYQRFILAEGNGSEESGLSFKAEWMTVKDDKLYIGSFGTEWIWDHKILHYYPEWIKIIDKHGTMDSYLWRDNYYRLRDITKTHYPGYITFEAVEWNPYTSKWLFLPRKVSTHTPFDPLPDELMASNILLIADEDFSSIKMQTIGPLQPEIGFSSMSILPDGKGDKIIALKVSERTIDPGLPFERKETHTYITVFDLAGKFYLDPWLQPLSSEIKFEGICFL